MEVPFQRVAIVGVGLIGGSLGLALHGLEPRPHVLGVGRDRGRLDLARRLGAVDDCSLSVSDVSGCDLVVLAMPIESILSALDRLGESVSAGSVVTDVGSTKRRICAKAWQRLPRGVEFIGGHPVAGREVAGVEHSLPGLFRGAPYILCPHPGRESGGVDRLRAMLDRIGALTSVLTAEEHDRALAWVSHLPQLLSTALAAGSTADAARLSGSGFRDMIRLAGSPFSVWSGILDTNRDCVEAALSEYIGLLEAMRGRLRDGGIDKDFEAAGRIYRQTRGNP